MNKSGKLNNKLVFFISLVLTGIGYCAPAQHSKSASKFERTPKVQPDSMARVETGIPPGMDLVPVAAAVDTVEKLACLLQEAIKSTVPYRKKKADTPGAKQILSIAWVDEHLMQIK